MIGNNGARIKPWTLLGVLCCVAAQTTAPSPATTQAVNLDLSSPKSAAKSVFGAIISADQATVAKGLDAADEQQRALANEIAGLLIAGKKLSDAAGGKFGEGNDVVGRPMLDP